jgi:O-antigen/teichoic acid export membrane protein
MEKLIWTKTLKRFMSVAGSSVLVVGLNTLATLYITRILSPHEYGQWLYFLSWFGLFRLLLGLGLGPKIIKDLSETRDNVSERNRRFWNMMMVRGFTIASMLILVLVVIAILRMEGTPLWVLAYGQSSPPDVLRNPQGYGVMGIVVSAAVAGVLAVMADSTLSTTAGLHKVAAHNVVLVAQPLIYIGGIAVTYVGRKVIPTWSSVWPIVGLYGLSYILAFLIGVVAVWRTGLLRLNSTVVATLGSMLARSPETALRPLSASGPMVAWKRSWPWKHLRSLGFVGGMYGVAILTYLFSVVGTMWLGTRQRYELTAAFGVPFNLVMLPGSLAQTAIVSTFYPSLCALLGQRSQRPRVRFLSARTLVTRFILCVVAVAVIGCFILALYSRPILRVIYSEKYVDAAEALVLLSPMVVLVPVELLMVYTFAALGRLAGPLLDYGIQVVAVILGTLWVGIAFLPGDIAKGLAVLYLVVKILGVVGLGLGLHRELSITSRSKVEHEKV